jgi:hypothetical protein
MRFFHNSCVGFVLKPSCIIYTLRPSARNRLAFIAMDGMYAGFAGAKACREKITIFGGILEF